MYFTCKLSRAQRNISVHGPVLGRVRGVFMLMGITLRLHLSEQVHFVLELGVIGVRQLPRVLLVRQHIRTAHNHVTYAADGLGNIGDIALATRQEVHVARIPARWAPLSLSW